MSKSKIFMSLKLLAVVGVSLLLFFSSSLAVEAQSQSQSHHSSHVSSQLQCSAACISTSTTNRESSSSSAKLEAEQKDDCHAEYWEEIVEEQLIVAEDSPVFYVQSMQQNFRLVGSLLL